MKVFDVGANARNKAAKFLERGALVVCFEPVRECLDELGRSFGHNDRLLIARYALASERGSMPMSVCSEATTISTLAESWKTGRFKGINSDRTELVEVRRLDDAIAEFGVPDYCKIDVEGYELSLIQGLSQKIPVLSFEFCRETLPDTEACLRRLVSLGFNAFNLAYGESEVMRHAEWRSTEEIIGELTAHPSPLVWGVIYAVSVHPLDPALASLLPAMPVSDEQPILESDSLQQLLWRGLSYAGVQVRLHLGCGEQLLPGYINIDYPAKEHNVMAVLPDYSTDITTLNFPAQSVDEIKLHHVFEHFNRVVALGLLIRWHEWLKIGGRLLIETPDFEGEARAFLDMFDRDRNSAIEASSPESVPASLWSRWRRMLFPDAVRASEGRFEMQGTAPSPSLADRMSAIRSLEGDQTAAWGYHVGHWFAERFEVTLRTLRFAEIEIRHSLSAHVPPLHNIAATAIRVADPSLKEQIEAAKELLWMSTVAEAERTTWKVWIEQLEAFICGDGSPTPLIAHVPLECQSSLTPSSANNLTCRIALPRMRDSALIAPVILRLQGGLGNQLFQYATGRALSLRLGTPLLFDLKTLQSDPLREFKLDAFTISGRIATEQEISDSPFTYHEPHYHYDEEFESIGTGATLVGYFQSERYFEAYRDQIRADLSAAKPLSSEFKAAAAKIRSAGFPVSLHVRRGDFVSNVHTRAIHGLCAVEYYEKAIAIIGGLTAEQLDVFVFSDDAQVAREMFVNRDKFRFIEPNLENPWEDMMLMSHCRHHILANSSFSWWGAWNNDRNDKIVVAPRNWVSDKALRQLNTADLHPRGTILI